MKYLLSLCLGLLLVSCTNTNKNADAIVEQAISTAGGSSYDNVAIQFTFRDKEYGAKLQGGNFQYIRLFKDSTDLYRDVLNNENFYRELNGNQVELHDTMSTKYSNSVNSVIYFALLPKSLNDPAVNRKYIGEKEIKGNKYHKIKVTFNEEGGGEDFEDQFIYWVNQNNNKIDYLAYQYYTDGGGYRFREAYNERYISDIRFVDYINFKPKNPDDISFDNIDDAYLNDNLEILSRVELNNIKVNSL